jgi:hypothetical protein
MVIARDGGLAVIVSDVGRPPKALDKANARLIAAAPELLEALREVLPLAEAYLAKTPTHPDNAKLEDARDALQKAEGR